MKHVLLAFVLLITTFSIAQGKYITKTGTVIFEASVPSFEEIKAKNDNTTAILNTENGEFAALVLVKGFRFKNALMEEHFNENYAESDDFPKATFKGKINNFSLNTLEIGEDMTYSGSLTFRGETKLLENKPISITILENNMIALFGDFTVNVIDFDIKIPSVVSKKLSKEVKVNFIFDLKMK
ncbi:YceI family protein [Lacinutrix chionoecetis]